MNDLPLMLFERGHVPIVDFSNYFIDLSGSDEDDHQVGRRPILRCRKSSIGEDRASSPEFLQSILKRRSSQEDLVSYLESHSVPGYLSLSWSLELRRKGNLKYVATVL